MRKTSAGLLVLTVLAALSASVAVAELVGDFNGNNEVGLSDFAHFLDSFGTTTSSTNWDPALDFNSDGEIGLSDFAIFLNNFGKRDLTGSGVSAASIAPLGQNAGTTIVLDLDAATAGNQAKDLQHNVGPNEAIDIAVYVTGAQNLKAYQVDLMFDTTKVAWNRFLTGATFSIAEPNFMKSAGGEFVFGALLNVGQPDVVTILSGIISATEANAPEGDGLIGVISFTTLAGFTTNDQAIFTVVFFEFSDTNNELDTFPSPSVKVHPGIQAFLWYNVKPVGDVNGSGEVTAFDAALLLKSTVGLFVISDTVVADVSGDSTISAFDASLILRFVIGKITQFPAETGGIAKVVLGERIISLGDIKALQDGRFAVPILIDEMDGLLSGQLELSFDPTKVKAVDAMTSDLTSDYLFAHNAQDGRLRLSFAGVESVNGSGRIAEIIFEPIGSEIKAIREVDLISAQLNEGLFTVIISQPRGISDVPATYALHQNFPNPFNPETVIYYDLAIRSYVSISVFNLMGQKVATLIDKQMDTDSHSAVWNGEDDNQNSLASGVYLYRMEVDGFVQTRRLVLMR